MPTPCQNRTLNRLVPVAAYPGILASGYLLFVAFQRGGLPLQASVYLVVGLAAGLILLIELYFPYRPGWKPDRSQLWNDSLFLAFMQVLLPRLLSFAAALLLVRWAGQGEGPLAGLWPHDAPIVVQAAVVVFVASFLRYWLHRACHSNRFLWRLHAVHHSPENLYWLNVGRFHPLEISLQFLLDALPFILLGVSPDVLALYFILYAVNGFFQHSNCRVRLGFLNYLVSGPELHRWHHSRSLRESNSNFGNNLIIWDCLFGTRYLPADREVGALGISNARYPQNFASQMTAPFVKDLNKA